MYFPFQDFSDIIFESLFDRLLPGGKIIIYDHPEARRKLNFMNNSTKRAQFLLRLEDLANVSKLYKAISISESAIAARLESYKMLGEEYKAAKALVFIKHRNENVSKQHSQFYTKIFGVTDTAQNGDDDGDDDDDDNNNNNHDQYSDDDEREEEEVEGKDLAEKKANSKKVDHQRNKRTGDCVQSSERSVKISRKDLPTPQSTGATINPLVIDLTTESPLIQSLRSQLKRKFELIIRADDGEFIIFRDDVCKI